MNKIIHSKLLVFGFPIAIFLLDVVFTASSNELVASTSPFMHFAGGAAMALFFLHFWAENLNIRAYPLLKSENPRLSASKSKNKFLFAIISVVAFAVLIGVLWEFAEFAVQYIFPDFVTQISIADTMADLFLDLLGGLSVVFLYSNS